MDGFPQNREHWAAMADSGILPDSVLSLEESEDNADTLLKRFMTVNGLANLPVYSSKQNQQQQIGKQHQDKENEVIDIIIYIK